ncbi:MAG: MarR family winged helix-turn-helix transcriptional regulator [Bacteriovoracaceae bacterium]
MAQIGSLLKKIYRAYNLELLSQLQERGFNDLRPSFLEILSFIADNEGPSIKEIGTACGLKKQTMTSHLNELETRGYIKRSASLTDKRESEIFLTAYGEKFKLTLLQVVNELEKDYSKRMGEVELERIQYMLEHLHKELNPNPESQQLLI